MSYGGGTWLFQNKELPGAYINFVSAQKALNSVSDRGYGALALELDWGASNEVFEVTNADFQKECLQIFGYDYTHEKMKGLRDFFKYAKTGYFYRLNSDGVKAENTFATAMNKGVRGNDIAITVEKNVDDNAKYNVITYMDGIEVDKQIVEKASQLKGNGYVTFKGETSLTVTVGEKLQGGTNGKEVTGSDHQKALDALEAVSFNTLGCLATNEVTKSLYIEYTKRMRDTVGAKFQTVVYAPNKTVDYEGVIAVTDACKELAQGAVYWVTGASAGCDVNRSNTNRIYNGEFEIQTESKQNKLSKAIRKGEFKFHKVGDDVRVLKDINTFISFTVYKNRDFSLNQDVRVYDQIAVDIAGLFNRAYLGKVQNNDMGRLAFYNDLVNYAEKLQQVEAIQNFDSKDITVTGGENKEDVFVEFKVQPTMAMEKLYMSVVVR